MFQRGEGKGPDMQHYTVVLFTVAIFELLLAPAAVRAGAGGQLAKLTINRLGEDGSVREPVEAHFNPKEFVIEKMSPWQNQSRLRSTDSELQWTRSDNVVYSFELFFDTAETSQGERDVKKIKKITKKIHSLADIDDRIGRPPTVLVEGPGGLAVVGILTYVRERRTMFDRDGTPTAAVLNIRIRLFTPTRKEQQKGR